MPIDELLQRSALQAQVGSDSQSAINLKSWMDEGSQVAGDGESLLIEGITTIKKSPTYAKAEPRNEENK